jgi:hypothetical protein
VALLEDGTFLLYFLCAACTSEINERGDREGVTLGRKGGILGREGVTLGPKDAALGGGVNKPGGWIDDGLIGGGMFVVV